MFSCVSFFFFFTFFTDQCKLVNQNAWREERSEVQIQKWTFYYINEVGSIHKMQTLHFTVFYELLCPRTNEATTMDVLLHQWSVQYTLNASSTFSVSYRLLGPQTLSVYLEVTSDGRQNKISWTYEGICTKPVHAVAYALWEGKSYELLI